ncbi:hypothetical protein BACUNI_03814 [Bacteroides uniformis ATCC 8492]|uniref:Uncharacterized protein n=1 Tax=Bacteroides uniformis (strain ATCC 8492 / DSM 6597 / CCUG 4942 / CIP 103695 / JCM 5828 / KCTC 5204 / NCTC 13054 / VPI 0061) TaxID=411479 RepID=A0ABC9N694_BACUC|nr:hypothetical protein BACUNI_03814 [Bacteroides uniformis ATCC 8492]
MFFAPGREFLVQIIFRCFKIFAHICSGIVYSMILLIFQSQAKIQFLFDK